MSEKAAVLFVNETFYEAFRGRDLETMDKLWAERAEVACIHPGWPALFGRAEVMESWEGILGNEEVPDIRCRDPRVFLLGAVAFVVCYEQLGDQVLAATNLFVREGGTWRLVHHQAGPCNLPPASLGESPERGPLQ